MRSWMVVSAAVLLPLLAGPAAAAPPERPLVVVPGEPQDIVVKGEGKPMRLVVGLYNGASLGGRLEAPKGCQGDDLSFNVIGMSTSGQFLAVATCKVLPAGTHTFHLDAGSSAFHGFARAYNATFA